MKTADQVSPDDRMVLARALCSWSGSERHAIEIPNHELDLDAKIEGLTLPSDEK